MKKTQPLVIKNVILLVLCGLPGALGNSEANDLQSTVRQNKATLYPHTTSSVDVDLRRSPASDSPKSTQTRQRWNADLLKINPRGDPTQKILPVEQSEEEDDEEDTEKVGQTTTVHMPTYFSYSTTRQANFRDRFNRIATNSTNNESRNRNSVNSRRNNQEVVSGSDGEDPSYTTTATITSNEPTMTYSSDILKLTTTNRSTSRPSTTTRLSSPTIESSSSRYHSSSSTPRGGRILTGRRKVNNGQESTTQIDENDRSRDLERLQQQLQGTTYISTSTTSLPVRLGQGYQHDVDKNLEYKVVELKKKPSKKETDGVGELVQSEKVSPVVVGGKTHDKQQHFFKENLPLKTDSVGKMKETLINGTERTDRPQVPDQRFSTIIDTLSKGSSNVPSNIESHKLIKNVTINNEPGTNLLETDNGGSKETNEKRDIIGNDDEAPGASGISDVIPVIIKNSVVGEGVIDLVNKTNGLKYPIVDDKLTNESFFLSSTLVTKTGSHPQEFESSAVGNTDVEDKFPQPLESGLHKNEELSAKIVQSKLPSGLLSASGKPSEVEKEDLEVKKKAYNLKKPLLHPIGGKLEDGFEVMLKNGSTSDEDTITPDSSSSLLNRTRMNGGNETNGDDVTKLNEQHKTRISSSTSRITSSFSSSSRTNLGSATPNNEEYTTFASNNLENNIITTSSPMFYGYTSTTPRINHYFSLRTTSTVQSQSATSAGENLIKQITSFNPRKRPATFFHQVPSSVSTIEEVEDHSGSYVELDNSSKTHSTEGTNYSNSPSGHRSSSSIRPSTIRKIVPWSTRLLRNSTSVETTTMEITTIDYSDVVTSPSPSRNLFSSNSPNWEESTASNSRTSESSKSHRTSSTTNRIPLTTFSSLETTSSSISTVASVDSSIPTSRFSEEASSVSPSSQLYSSFSSITPETPTTISISNFTRDNSTYTIGNVSNPETSENWKTQSEIPDFTNGTQRTNRTTTENSSDSTTSPYSSSAEVETKKSNDWYDSTTWSSTPEDSNSTEDLQFGDVDEKNWSVGSTTQPSQSNLGSSKGGPDLSRFEVETTVPSVFGSKSSSDSEKNMEDVVSTTEDDTITTYRPYITSKTEWNTTSSRPYTTTSNSRQNTTSNSILKKISTIMPDVNHTQNSTSIWESNITATPISIAHETEDIFDTDDEEIHSTTTLSTDGDYEKEGEEDVSHVQTTLKPGRDNKIVQKENENTEGSTNVATESSERGNFIMKIATTTEETPLWTRLWTTDVDKGESTTASSTTKMADTTKQPATPFQKVKSSTTPRPIRPMTLEPTEMDPPKFMGLSLLVKGSTMNEICAAQPSLKKAIMFLFRNTTGRILDENQIVFPSLTPEDCRGHNSPNNGLHNVDLVLYDENGNFDDELNREFRSLWASNGLGTNIAIHDVYFILRPAEDLQSNTMTIAVIVISCIGLTCLLLFFILMMILRKRQKKFNYGQRCTPVSLDDYSLDNISVYNSIRRKNARRASKRSYGNPAFDDPSAPSHQMNFAALSHFSSNRTAMNDEFSEIPMMTAKMDELPPGAETRNRYANVIPLPETRVQLSVREGDDPATGYINANYIKGPKGADKFYIACQAPMQSTVNDFWRMIWEQQSKLILMLTDLHENGVEKCFDYLPPSEVLDCHRLFGDYQVTLKKREVREKYVISHLQLKNLDSNLWREVTHLWYTSWPHQGVPTEGTSMIAFLIEARSYMRNTSGPHIVHCSPGVGRTGTVLAIDLCIREFEASRMVDVPKTVYGLRRNRAGCVQTKDQYAFIYTVLNVYGTKLTGGALDSM